MRQVRAVTKAPDLHVAFANLRAHLERLARDVDATRRDEGFLEALRTMARFWRYSFLNQFLIGLQRPGATRAAGRRTWESLGRRVMPRERPLFVFAPSRRSDGGIRFRPVRVYDICQTRGRALPALDLDVPGYTSRARLLEDAGSRLGIEVVTAELPAGIAGRSSGGRVEIAPGLTGRKRAGVLAHELAHEVLHQAERRRAAELKRPGPSRTTAERETEAEATSYVVLRTLGIPSKAPAYIAWQGETGEAVLRSFTRVQRAARTILLAAEGKPGAARARG